MGTPSHQDDEELLAIEARIAELARTRAEHLREAEALSKGMKGFMAAWRGDQDQRIDDAIATAKLCKIEIDRLREEHERRLAKLDPDRAEEVAMLEERKVILEQAATVRKMGGSSARTLSQLDDQRKKRLDRIEHLEHVMFVGDHAEKALSEYRRRLSDEAGQLEADAMTARIGTLASTQTAGAEAQESLVHFLERVEGGADVHIRIRPNGSGTRAEEIAACIQNLDEVRALMRTTRDALDAARLDLRPIETAYRNFLTHTTASSAPERTHGPPKKG
ncbi:MAG: hypothetical protein H6737_22165 [Alphaproteobacteria bacterium]|nr:hypothetical protein [Alphaproteobacteria bacterium]